MGNFCVKCGSFLAGGPFCTTCGADARSAGQSVQPQPASVLEQHHRSSSLKTLSFRRMSVASKDIHWLTPKGGQFTILGRAESRSANTHHSRDQTSAGPYID